LGEQLRPALFRSVRSDLYLPELDIYIEDWGMDTADYKVGLPKKKQLYQQKGTRLISVYPSNKRRPDYLLRRKLALFGHQIPTACENLPTPGRVGER
jgi:hypothetical protein